MVTKCLRAPYSVSLYEKSVRFYGAYTALLRLRIQFKYSHLTKLRIIVSLLSIVFALQLISINRSIKHTPMIEKTLMIKLYKTSQ